MIRAEYIWIDGNGSLRGKTKFVNSLKKIKDPWIFDGSSTNQAVGQKSDCVLIPVREYKDLRYKAGHIVLCEVFNTNGTEHNSNSRRRLSKLLKKEAVSNLIPRVGFEQEYFIMRCSDSLSIGFPEGLRSNAKAQGKYYCGVGRGIAFGRKLVDSHAEECIYAGISLEGINAEVAPGQWEYQIGGPNVDILKACDDAWVARYLIMRQTEDKGLYISFEQKPISGDWNGSGMHTNFSTTTMRASGGIKEIYNACTLLSKRIDKHMKVYGAGYKKRLTGKYETAKYDEFTYGVSDRGASIRIPHNTAKNKCGYLEDRRPGANADPYEVIRAIIETVILEE